MADAASRRAERRKKILENSEDRLKKIMGGCHLGNKDICENSIIESNSHAPTPVQLEEKKVAGGDWSKVNSPENERLILSATRNSPDWTETDSGICDVNEVETDTPAHGCGTTANLGERERERHFSFPKILEEHRTVVRNKSGEGLGTGPVEPSRMQVWMAYVLSSRAPLILLAFATHALLRSELAFLVGNSAMIPFALGEAAHLCLGGLFIRPRCISPHQQHRAGGGVSQNYFPGNGGYTNSKGGTFLGAALMLSGMHPERVATILRTATTAQTVLQDFAVFLFSFAAVHTLLR